MNHRERLALAITAAILIGLPLIMLGYQFVLRPRMSNTRVIDIRAAAPENGGFQPDSISVEAGETITLRFYSVDVTHGVAIGPGLGVDLGSIDPGQVKEVTLRFSEAGTYTFYCNTWCSRDHWRMRGVVEVIDPAHSDLLPTVEPDPVIEALAAEGVDIDARVHQDDEAMAHIMALPSRPSAERGGSVIGSLSIPAEVESLDWRRTHTPQETADLLRAANAEVPEQDLLDAVAYLWLSGASAEQLAEAQTLYNKNCAACHGELGGGDGPVADATTETPAAFGNANYMWQMRSDVLYAKIRRGGMGTDMPNFGTLFTQGETWTLVDYLWSLTFQENENH